jgi:hypothetical protein
LVGNVVSAVALVELQEEAEEEEEPVQRQMLLVLRLGVLERKRKKVVVAKETQEVGTGDAADAADVADSQSREVIMMGLGPKNPETVGRRDVRGGAGSGFAEGQDSISWGLPAVRGETEMMLIFRLLMRIFPLQVGLSL